MTAARKAATAPRTVAAAPATTARAVAGAPSTVGAAPATTARAVATAPAASMSDSSTAAESTDTTGLSSDDLAILAEGGVPCYLRTPAFTLIPGSIVTLNKSLGIPSFCIDGLVFGLTTVIGGLGLFVSVGLIGAAIGSKNPAFQAAVGVASKVLPAGKALSAVKAA